MITVIRAWLATFTRRWHANPDLCHTTDSVGWHSSRMAVLALQIWPYCSRELIVACLYHDLGECVTGDVPWAVKRAHPELARMLNEIEGVASQDMGALHPIDAADCRRLKYLDRLDAYLWVKHHAPHILTRGDWRECRAWLKKQSSALGVAITDL